MFFVTPLVLLLILNVIFLSLSTSVLCKDPSIHTPHHLESKYNAGLYIRLVFYSGLTWIFGFVAIFLDHEIIWIIFIILNASQGFFVSLSCMSTKQVLSYLYDVLCTSKSCGRKSKDDATGDSSIPSVSKETPQTLSIPLSAINM